jgi:group I intron endonuclease
VTPGIYCIENKINGKKYIGKSKYPDKRMFAQHKHSIALNGAIDKYGKDNFNRYILIYCDEKDLDELEKHYIEKLKSYVRNNGYNLTLGGGGSVGLKHRKISIKRMSGKNNHNYGKSMPTEQKNKIKDSLIGHTLTSETKLKISLSLLGKPISEETKKKISISLVGKKKPNKSSEYYGVRKNFLNNKYTYWRAAYKYCGKYYHIGQYKTEIEAALAYDNHILLNGIELPLNFNS